MTENLDRLPVEFVRQLVDMANANNAVMDGTMQPVLQLIAANDMVVGVWEDSDAPGGVGLLIVKGANKLRDIATGLSEGVRIAAIKCMDPEQAEALRRHIASDSTH